MPINENYKGNLDLKKHNVYHEYTKEEIQEYIKCANDVTYFAQNYIKVVHPDKGLISIELYDYQKRMLNHLNDNRHSIILSSRQTGKCVSGETKITIKDDEGIEKEILISELYERLLLSLTEN